MESALPQINAHALVDGQALLVINVRTFSTTTSGGSLALANGTPAGRCEGGASGPKILWCRRQ